MSDRLREERLRLIAIALAVLFLTTLPAGAHSDPADDEDLVARERIRSQVEGIIAELNSPAGREPAELFRSTTTRLHALGPPVVPYLAAEIDQPTAFTYNVAAYVLGLIGTDEARAGLEKAIRRVDTSEGRFQSAQKSWALLGMAMAGGPRSLELMAEGTWVGALQMLEGTTLVELAALVTAPESVPVLVGWLTRFDTDETVQPRLIYTIRALGRIADPSVRDVLLPFLEHKRWHLRKEAVLALAKLGDTSLADRVLALLEDDTVEVRLAAADALDILQPPGKVRQVLLRLQTEEDTGVRVRLYAWLASTKDPSLLEAFRSHWGREDYLDRSRLMRAVGELGDPKGLNLLREGLRDPIPNVAASAAIALASIDSPAARDSLLAAIRTPGQPGWSAIDELTALGEHRAAPRIADRLLQAELAHPVSELSRRDDIRFLGDALVTLRYTKRIADLKKAIEGQTDPIIVEYLRELVNRLTAIEQRGEDVETWSELLASPDAALRLLAVDRLADLGGKQAVQALSRFFDTAQESEKVRALEALARIGSSDALPLVEKVLMGEAYDDPDSSLLRDTAAWAARQIGAHESVDLLRRSVKRRQGRDEKVLIYLALLDGKNALPELAEYRLSRLRDLQWWRGLEQERIDWMRRELSAGRTISSLDLPPEELEHGHW